MGAQVKVFDPVSIESCQRNYPELEIAYSTSLEDLAKDSDALVLVTEWQEFCDSQLEAAGEEHEVAAGN